MDSGNKSSATLVFGELLFLKLFQTFRMAIQPSKLIITSAALALISLSGWLMDFSQSVAVMRDDNGKIIKTELDIYKSGASYNVIREQIQNLRNLEERGGVFSILWSSSSTCFKNAVDSVYAHNVLELVSNINAFFKSLEWALRYHFIYCIIFFVIVLAVLSVAGGAICRMAALQNAQGEKPGLTQAVRFSLKRFTNLFSAPLTPFLIILVISVFILLLGLIGNIPAFGEIIIGLGMPLVLFAGVLIAVVLIGAIGGLNLMFPAIAYDGSDNFDSISRSFSYVFARPWRMLFYTAISAVYGSICYTFVRFVAFLSLSASRTFLRASIWTNNSGQQANKLDAIWPKPEFTNLFGFSDVTLTSGPEKIAHFLIYIFVLVVIGLVVSFIISFYFSANTIIYSLLRNKVDNTPIEDIYTDYNEANAEITLPEN